MATGRHAPPKFETVLFEKRGPICFITLNRTEKLNAAAFVEKRKPAFKGR